MGRTQAEAVGTVGWLFVTLKPTLSALYYVDHIAVLDRALNPLEVIDYHIHAETEAGPGRVIICAGEEPSSASSASYSEMLGKLLNLPVFSKQGQRCVWALSEVMLERYKYGA